MSGLVWNVEPRPNAAEAIARVFHERYEWWAKREGWTTQQASAVPWADVPEANRRTMIQTVQSLLDTGVIVPGAGL